MKKIAICQKLQISCKTIKIFQHSQMMREECKASKPKDFHTKHKMLAAL